jgi:uncharacterized protein
MPEARIIDTISGIDREAWNSLFPGEVEDYDYLLAVETAGMDGFQWRYVIVEEDGRLVAAAPAFITDYPLETTMGGAARRLAGSLRSILPRLGILRLACLGSPCTETAQLGQTKGDNGNQGEARVHALMAAFEACAKAERCGLLAIKDIRNDLGAQWAPALKPERYCPLPGLPVAELPVTFDSIEAYLAGLSAGTRKDMRRKLRARDSVRIEVRRDLDGLEDQVMALYAETRARGDLQFETLTSGYFTGVLRRMGDRAACILYFVDEDLLAANLVLIGSNTLLDKFFCMSAAGRAHNLYFLSWFTNLGLCLERGLARYQSGQAAYANKLRLGSRLQPTTMYFRHRNRLLNQVLRWASPLFAPVAPQEASA